MRTSTATAAGCLTAYVALGVVYRGRPPRHERVAFARLNHDLGRQPWLRAPQQLGTPWTLPAVAVAAYLRGERRLATAALAALPLEKGLEVGTKKLVRRPRPAQALAPTLRDDAPTDGPSYPSGHAAIAACAVWMLAPLVPSGVVVALAACAGLTALARVQQGAHLLADAVGGLALGCGIGSLLTRAARTGPGPVGLASVRAGRRAVA